MDARLERVTEARALEALPGGRTYSEVNDLLVDALKEHYGAGTDWLWVRDFTDEWVVFSAETDTSMILRKVGYSVADDGVVTFDGEPVEVEDRHSYEPVGARTSEAVRMDGGRVIEAKGTDSDGGRVYDVLIVAAGTSVNGNRYPAHVLEAAAPLYEGAKAFDHHRTLAELASSSIDGLVGSYRSVSADQAGVRGELHLLPSADRTAEALDASIEAQAKGLPPLVGISHDVQMVRKPVVEGGRRIQEATHIGRVLSADVVADPSAGGHATRVVAGGIGSDPTDTPPSRKDTTAMNLKQLLALLRQAKTDADRAALLEEHKAVVDDSGYTAEEITTLAAVEESPEAPGGPASGDPAPTGDPAPAEDAELELVTESIQGHLVIREAVTRAGLDEGLIPVVASQLGKRFTESQLATSLTGYQRVLEGIERGGLRPGVPHVEVGEEDLEKKTLRVERTFEGNFDEGYASVKEMFLDISPQRFSNWSDPDLGSAIIREAFMGSRVEGRATESVSSSTFGNVLADVMNRRTVAEYKLASLDVWRLLVSSIVPLNDFRQQKVVRFGGYGTLPTVLERGPYQPLTTPSDEKVTYSPTKKGGTEDYTFEAAMNDDMRTLTQIPTKLGRAAAMTLYRAVFDLLPSNPTIYDSVQLFASGHANTDNPAVLTSSTLATGRRKMRKQSAYGNSVDVLGTTPKYLVVPSDLEEMAFQLTASAVAIPASGNASNIPNLHQGMTPLVVDYWSDTNDWFIVADPNTIPTIEVGFLNGRQDPELFVQDSPTVGSNFNADIITWKIRHIWGLAVLDYRGFYRGAN